jgi:CobQ-like glutamine amidotransferase family enzyme
VRTLAVPDEGAGKYVVEAVVLENAVAAVVPKSYVHGCALATNASIINAHVKTVLKGFIWYRNLVY